MRRIAVIGCSGSGKSRLSTQLGERLGLPVVHLDRLFWQPGWRESPRAEFEARQRAALPADGAWIADGSFTSTLALRLSRADTIVLLDLPTRVCLRRAVKRAWGQRGRTRADMGEGCPEHVFAWSYVEFLLYIVRFRRDELPRTMRAIAEHGAHARLVHLRSDGEIARFVDAAQPAAMSGVGR